MTEEQIRILEAMTTDQRRRHFFWSFAQGKITKKQYDYILNYKDMGTNITADNSKQNSPVDRETISKN